MIVIIHNIRSLHNVGSIFRTADAVGVEKIYLCGITPAPINEFGKPRQQLTKVSLGAEKYVKWEKVKSTTKLIDKLRRSKEVGAPTKASGLKNPPSANSGGGGGYKIFAIEQSKKSIPYYKVKCQISDVRCKKIALVLGNEIKGLPLSILSRAERILEIPMRGAMVRQAHHPRHKNRGKESLNVAVAFGIIAFHLIYTYN